MSRDSYWQLVDPYWDAVDIGGDDESFVASLSRVPQACAHLLATHWCEAEVATAASTSSSKIPRACWRPRLWWALRPSAAEISPTSSAKQWLLSVAIIRVTTRSAARCCSDCGIPDKTIGKCSKRWTTRSMPGCRSKTSPRQRTGMLPVQLTFAVSYSGTEMMARSPPIELSPSVMSPPWLLAMSRAMARPRPLLPPSWLRARSSR